MNIYENKFYVFIYQRINTYIYIYLQADKPVITSNLHWFI